MPPSTRSRNSAKTAEDQRPAEQIQAQPPTSVQPPPQPPVPEQAPEHESNPDDSDMGGVGGHAEGDGTEEDPLALLRDMLHWSKDKESEYYDETRAEALTAEIQKCEQDPAYIEEITDEMLRELEIIDDKGDILIPAAPVAEEKPPSTPAPSGGDFKFSNLPTPPPDRPTAQSQGEVQEKILIPSPDGSERFLQFGACKTVAYNFNRGTEEYINRYGGENPWFRVESIPDKTFNANDAGMENFGNRKSRPSYELADNGKLKYTRRHIRGVLAIAFVGSVGNATDIRKDVELINPENIKDRWPIVRVRILWDLDNDGKNMVKVWEPMTTLRDRWGTKKANQAVYDGACDAMTAFLQSGGFHGAGRYRSPSAGVLVRDTVEEQRALSLEPQTPSPAPRGSSSPVYHSSAGSRGPVQLSQEEIDQIKQDIAEYLNSKRFDLIPNTQQTLALKLYRQYKADYLATAAAAA